MGEFEFPTRTRQDRAAEIGRIIRKLEQRLKALLVQASRRIGRGEASHSRICPKQLLATLSNKAAPLIHRKRNAAEEKQGRELSGENLWQKEILMGEKCQPLDFSGVIYYDKDGNPSDGMPPRTPRGSPLVRKQSFSFPASLPEKTLY